MVLCLFVFSVYQVQAWVTLEIQPEMPTFPDKLGSLTMSQSC